LEDTKSGAALHSSETEESAIENGFECVQGDDGTSAVLLPL